MGTDLSYPAGTLPPHSIEAEQAVLGAILIEPNALRRALEVLSADDFYRDSHRRIFRVMVELAEMDAAPELVAVVDRLDAKGETGKVGGVSYVSQLASGVPTAANVTYHARIIREKAARRRLAETCQGVFRDLDEGADLGELIKALREIPVDVEKPTPDRGLVSAAEVLADAGETEYLIDGLIPVGALVLVSAPQGNYKTILTLAMAQAVSTGSSFLGYRTAQAPVYVVDRENIRVTHRNYFRLLGIGPGSDIRLWPLWGAIEPPPLPAAVYMSITDSFIVFDSLVRFYPNGTNENDPVQMSTIMNFLRGFARQGNTVIVLHHVSKNSDSDYRGTTDIAAAVDVAYRIHRHGEGSRKLSLRCFKSRFFEEFELPFEVVMHPGGGLSFDTAPDRDLEDIEALYDLMAGRILNQTQIFTLAQEKLGLKNKGRLIHLLKEGEGHQWERTRQGKRVLYCPNNCLSTVPPIRGGDSKTVDKDCSERQETVGGNGDGKNLNNQHLSGCPGGAETVKTVENCQAECSEAQFCSRTPGQRAVCGGPL